VENLEEFSHRSYVTICITVFYRRQRLESSSDFHARSDENTGGIFMLNPYDARGYHTKSDENLIFLPARPYLRPHMADSLIVRILIFIADGNCRLQNK